MEPLDLDSLRTIPVLQAGELFGFRRTQTYTRVYNGTFPVPVRRIGSEWRVRVLDLRLFFDDECGCEPRSAPSASDKTEAS